MRITVRVIAAEPGAGEKDARLGPVENNLEMLPFRYGSYKLLDERTFDLDWKSDAQMELPGSRSLLVTPRDMGPDGRIRVHLEVLGAHPEHQRKLHTDYSIARYDSGVDHPSGAGHQGLGGPAPSRPGADQRSWGPPDVRAGPRAGHGA